jgi:dTDP-4-amino-4,6-dideoxygalactose transaminase
MPIPFADLRSAIEQTEPEWRQNLDELHRRSSYILGHQLATFEQEFAAAVGARFAVGVGSGSDAIELSLREQGVTEARQQVITSALTAPFTAVAIAGAGATPVFADVDPDDLHIHPEDVARRINKRTAAIVPVHLYGEPAKIQAIAKLARAAKLPLIQDACQAHASARYTRYSSHVAYSFYPTKNLGALGDAGAITTDSPRVARRLREMRDGGRRGGQVCYGPGINSRLDELQACYLRAFLTRLPEWNARRQVIAAMYDERLAKVRGIGLVKRSPESVCHLYIVRAQQRNQLRQHLAQLGIATGIHYPVPLHLQPAFKAAGQRRGDLPHAEKACREILSLPIHPFLSDLQVKTIAESVNRFYS